MRGSVVLKGGRAEGIDLREFEGIFCYFMLWPDGEILLQIPSFHLYTSYIVGKHGLM